MRDLRGDFHTIWTWEKESYSRLRFKEHASIFFFLNLWAWLLVLLMLGSALWVSDKLLVEAPLSFHEGVEELESR